jgi:hypothetical protein
MNSQHVYEVRPRRDKRGVDLISAIDHAKFFSRSHDAVIRVYDDAGSVIETYEHKGEFNEC